MVRLGIISPMAQDGRMLVMMDGGLAGLVAAACAAEEAVGRGQESKPLLWWASVGDVGAPRRSAARRQAEHFGLELVERELSAGVLDRSTDREPSWIGGPGATTLLIAAAREADRAEIERVVWAAQAGSVEEGGGASPDLTVASEIVDRALLVGRLVSLDRGSPGVRIETPFADLDDSQLADLALDVGVPMELCWWRERDSGDAAAGAERARWERALTEVGVPGPAG